MCVLTPLPLLLTVSTPRTEERVWRIELLHPLFSPISEKVKKKKNYFVWLLCRNIYLPGVPVLRAI